MLACLAIDANQGRLLIAQGGLSSLLRHALRPQTSYQEEAAWALACLSSVDANAAELAAAGALEILLELAHAAHVAARLQVCRPFLAKHPSHSSAPLPSTHPYPPPAARLQFNPSYSLSLTSPQAVWALANLAANSNIKLSLGELNGPIRIVGILCLLDPTTEQEAITPALRAISNLLVATVNRHAFIDGGGLVALLEASRHLGTDPTVHARLATSRRRLSAVVLILIFTIRGRRPCLAGARGLGAHPRQHLVRGRVRARDPRRRLVARAGGNAGLRGRVGAGGGCLRRDEHFERLAGEGA